ncbi:polysaccharide pyruvyl transferase family protein [Leptothoe sp. PORK10 BA2]|uniref:polysaccharide pyruvyl transferase family protein n=1 Tax=Leptothoe sp. PORK10 BA2 TaxID=3110254 RepID=UPI002B1F1ED1|nr:polysaccharide pyruvyl transferase family protein [Leptothoe sp. PORK10 BA2]MEA5465234.1 polysaccharide pyruvyl transferase family protein [Leptothoe sp. PORK10 BA2]
MVWGNGILVCGFYGYRNLGDEAMLSGLRHWLQRCGCDLPLTVYSKDPEDTRLRHGVSVLDNRYAGGRRARLQKWLRHRTALATHRFFILGGGDLLRDDPVRDVAGEWLQPLEQAVWAGKRTLVLGISVGKLWRPETQARIKTVLNQVDLIAVRDRISQQRLISLGVSQPVHEMSDLALEIVAPKDYCPPADSHPNIGISVRPVAGRNEQSSDDSFYQHLATLADHLVEIHGATIHLLPFQAYNDDFRQRYCPPVDDEVAIAEVVNRSRHPEKLHIVPRIDSLDELIQRLSQLDMMVGTRLHAVILAAGLGVPVVAIEYAPKVTGFMKAINQEQWSIPLADFTAQHALERVNTMLSAGETVRQQLRQGVDAYRSPMDQVDRLLKDVLL